MALLLRKITAANDEIFSLLKAEFVAKVHPMSKEMSVQFSRTARKEFK